MRNDNRHRRNQPPTGEGKKKKLVHGAPGERRRAQFASAKSRSLKETLWQT